jgi:hypothetical protein
LGKTHWFLDFFEISRGRADGNVALGKKKELLVLLSYKGPALIQKKLG